MANLPGLPEDFNPYRAPQANLDAVQPVGAMDDLAEVESIRRRYLKHEASIKSLGSLSYLGGIIGLGRILFLAVMGSSLPQATKDSLPLTLAIYGIAIPLNLALGYGLTTLKSWARWMMVVLTGLTICNVVFQAVVGNTAAALPPDSRRFIWFGFAFWALIIGYILNLLLSSKGAFVFSAPYREIIRLTPHVRYKSGCIVKIAMGFFGVVVVFVLIGIFAVMFRR